MVKSNSSGGLIRDHNIIDPDLQRRADEYHRQNEAKAKVYWESRARLPLRELLKLYHGMPALRTLTHLSRSTLTSEMHDWTTTKIGRALTWPCMG